MSLLTNQGVPVNTGSTVSFGSAHFLGFRAYRIIFKLPLFLLLHVVLSCFTVSLRGMLNRHHMGLTL